MSRLRKGIVTGLILVGALMAGVFVVGHQLEQWRAPTREKWNRVTQGMEESAVREVLGDPIREFNKTNAPVDYYEPGYGFKKREITGKVLIYLATDLVLYVYLDESGRVEETVIASS